MLTFLLDSKNPDKNIERMFGLIKQLSNILPECTIKIRLHPLEDGTLWREKIDFIKYQ